ncbi:MAG: tetratricopeptide repeat protein [Bryobacteraceae bacterium]
MYVVSRVLLAIGFGAAALAADETLDLRGEIENCPSPASVVLHGATTPFHASAYSDAKCRFRFRKLKPGSYTLSVFIPGAGEARQTVTVTPSLAGDNSGVVNVSIPFEFTEAAQARSAAREGSVSMRELTISKRARKEYEEAQKRLGKHDVIAAIEHLERAVELAPQFVAAWNSLGTIAYQSKRYDSAERYFREALDHEPGAFEPVVNLGGTLLSRGNIEEALRYNQFAIDARPDDALANSQIGLNYFLLGDHDKALPFLEKAKRLDPAHFSHPQLILAEIHLLKGDPKAGLRELNDFLDRHPDSPRASSVRQQIAAISQQL